jgi:hypothetical protein
MPGDGKPIGHVKFSRYSCDIFAHRYRGGGGVALELIEQGTGQPVAVATVNMPEAPREGCVWAKDWMENEGLMAEMTAAKIWAPTGRTAPSGHVLVYECRLLAEIPGEQEG